MRNNIEKILIVLVIICYGGYCIGNIYGFCIFPDEFAYWSYAAYYKGFDWSDITSLGPFFSYGYSFILAPIFALCMNSIIAYKAAVLLNFLLIFLTFIVTDQIVQLVFPKYNLPHTFICAIAVFFPSNLFYAQMTLTETVILFCYTLLFLLLLYYLRTDSIVYMLGTLGIAMYLYMVHMRTVGILIAVLLSIVYHVFKDIHLHKKRIIHAIVLSIGFILFLFICINMKQWALQSVFHTTEVNAVNSNDYSGQIGKIQYVLTKKGFYDLIVSILGKFLYLGLASYGLFYWGFGAALYSAIKLIKNTFQRKEVTIENQICFFLSLCVLIQIAISSVYLLTLGEIEDYTYGRYNEFLLPIIMILGVFTIWEKRGKIVWIVTLIITALQAGAVYLVVQQTIRIKAEVFHPYFIPGISYFYKEKNFSVSDYYMKGYLFSIGLMLIVTVVLMLAKTSTRRKNIVSIILVLEILLALRLNALYLKPFSKAAWRDSRLTVKITELKKEDSGRVLFLVDTYPSYIGIIQFMDRDTDIEVISKLDSIEQYREILKEDDIVIMSYDNPFLDELKKDYHYSDTYGHFTMLAND